MSSYKVFFTNFGYYSANESETEAGARKIAVAAGYQCHIELDGAPVLSYAPGVGFRTWYPDRPSTRGVE